MRAEGLAREQARLAAQQQQFAANQAAAQEQAARQQRAQNAQEISSGIFNVLESQRAADAERERRKFERSRRQTAPTYSEPTTYPSYSPPPTDTSAAWSEQQAAARQAAENAAAQQAAAEEAARRQVAFQAAEAERAAARARHVEQERQARLVAAKQDFSGLLAEYRATPTASAEPTSAASAFAALFGEATSRSAHVLANELVGQVANRQEPNLRDAARSGTVSVIKETVAETGRAIYDAALDLLPRERQNDVRSLSLPLSWMTMDVDQIKSTYREFIQKEIV